jgi:hypothetical protein
MHEVIAKNLHHGSIHRRLRERKHVPQPLVHKPDLHVTVCDQNAFHHARENRSQTEVLVCDSPCHLPLPPGELFQLPMNFPHDSRTRRYTGKFTLCNQQADFASQKLKATPKQDQKHAKDARRSNPNDQQRVYHED